MIVLSKSIAQQIESEGVRAYPNECCGILIGKEKDGRRVVERLAPMKNNFDRAERYHRFTIDPLAQIEAEKSADDAGQVGNGAHLAQAAKHPSRVEAASAVLAGWRDARTGRLGPRQGV